MKLRLVMLLVCSMMSAACGSSTKVTVNSEPNTATNSAIVLAEQVQVSATNSMIYLTALSSLPTTQVDRSASLELSSADVAVVDGKVFTRDRSAKTVTRYSVDANLKLNAEGVVSFANKGLGSGRTYDAYLSGTQAYALDGTNMQLIEWNPATLELTGKSIDISQYSKSDLDLSFGPPLKVGTKVYVQVSWSYQSDTSPPVIYPKLAVMIIDGLGGTPPIIEDARVGPGFALYSDGAGNLYAPGFISAAYSQFGSTSNGGDFPPDGVLRLISGASSFDSSYQVNLTDIIKSPSTYAAWRLDDTHVLSQCVNPNSNQSSDWSSAQDVVNSGDFIYALVDTDAKSWTQLSAPPQGPAATPLPLALDGKVYVQAHVAANGQATGSQVAAVQGTTATAAFQVPSGDLWHLQRVR